MAVGPTRVGEIAGFVGEVEMRPRHRHMGAASHWFRKPQKTWPARQR